MIRAGTNQELCRSSGTWAFLDIGFAREKKSNCLLLGNGEPELLTFAQMRERLVKLANSDQSEPLNLLLEAPLSSAFTPDGNPTGRIMEKKGAMTRYWYAGPGPAVLLASTYLLRGIFDAMPAREIRLFEGFVSFKEKGKPSDHELDVRQLREAVWSRPSANSDIYFENEIKACQEDQLRSAFLVAGMDFGVPPVIITR